MLGVDLLVDFVDGLGVDGDNLFVFFGEWDEFFWIDDFFC